MRALGRQSIMFAMRSPELSGKVVLVADRREPSGVPTGTGLRRYRLARLRLDGRSHDPAARFEHLKRVFD
jgi:hypothetical protein